MTKRILAMLLAVLLMCTMFVGCFDKKDDKDDEAAAKDASTPKAQLIDGLTKTLFGQSGMDFTVPELSGDMLGDIRVKLNELSAMGTNYLENGPVDLTAGISVDGDAALIEVNASATWMGETPTMKAVLGEQGVYITDLLGVNDKPVLITFADMDMDASEFTEVFGQMGKLTGVAQSVLDALSAAVEKHIPDSAFTAETKDVDVNGTAFSNATVINATLTAEMAENILVDLGTALADNEAFKELTGEEINPEDVRGQLGQGELVIAGTLAEGKVVALDAKVTSEGEEVGSLVCSFLPTGTKIAVTANGEELFVFDAKLDGENITASVSYNDYGETVTPVKAQGTYKDGKFDGTVTVEVDGQGVTIDCSAQATETGASISVTEIGMNVDGMNVSLPIELTIALTEENGKQTVSMAVKFDYMGLFNIDAELSYGVQMSDVTVSPVSGAVSMDEVDVMTWSQTIMTKYPNITGWITEVMAGAVTDAMAEDLVA